MTEINKELWAGGMPPVEVKKAGYVWIIVDVTGSNWVQGRGGATLFCSKQEAEDFMAEIKGEKP